MNSETKKVSVNGRQYLWPDRPCVVVCIDGVEQVLDNSQGCEQIELANDRMGDLILILKQDTVLGTTADRHDLSGLEVPLRSHGGVTEQQVSLIVSTPVSELDPGRQLRNFDIFNVALNHTAA